VANYKEEAIVLRAHDLSEADRIVSLLTAGKGLRRAVAKGVKRTGSKFGARLEPFTHMNAVLHEGRNLDTVVQVETISNHAPLREDYDKYLYGQAMLEMIEKSLHEYQNIPRVFDALRITLHVLEGEVSSPALLLAAFEFKICALIGYHPHLDKCLHCGRDLGSGNAWLDLSAGGTACMHCRRHSQDLIALSPEMLGLMRGLLSEDMATISRWQRKPRLTREVVEASFRFSESFLERPLRSRQVVLSYLDQARGKRLV
jgi:DNA repair protein RecO (recombination protein O)